MANWRILSDLAAQEVKGMLWNGYRHGHVSKFYPVTKQVLQQIMTGETYRDVPWPDGTCGALPIEKKEEHFNTRLAVRSTGAMGKMSQKRFSEIETRLRDRINSPMLRKQQIEKIAEEEGWTIGKATEWLDKHDALMAKTEREIKASEELKAIEQQQERDRLQREHENTPETPGEIAARLAFPTKRWEQKKSNLITRNALALQDAEPTLSVDDAIAAAKAALWVEEFGPEIPYGMFSNDH